MNAPTDTFLMFTAKQRFILACLFDGNYWSPEELRDTTGAHLDSIHAFLARLERDGWVERLDDEEPQQWRRTPDLPEAKS